MTPIQAVPDQLTLHLETGSISFNCPHSTAVELNRALDTLVKRLKTVATDPKSPQPAVEFRNTEGFFLEVFCNPNIWPTPYAAKLNLTLKTDRVRLSTELLLSQVREDIGQFLGR
ncbi:MAG: hypothetical protein AB4040_19355 [Synechococcus sp.]